jgi:hypothetical protein
MNEPNREASIHITESKLRDILYEVGVVGTHDLVNQILLRARKYSLSHRQLLVSNDRQAKQADKITKASLEPTTDMAKTIYMIRKSLRHRGIEISKPGSKDWPYIKNITKNALEFNETYNITGFKTYIDQAVKEIGKVWSLAKIQSYHLKIIENYAATLQLKNNTQSEFTDRAYREYNRHIIQTTGTILNDYSKEPKEFRYFMDVANICKLLGINPELYITAQFEGLAWAGGIPEPKQLIGPTADKRLQKYLFANKINLKQEPERNEEKVNKFKALRKLK